MKLIAGLGNPGKKYDLTRHNIGFTVIDDLLEELHCSSFEKSQHKALVSKTPYKETTILLVKPMTYMNLSGDSIVSLMSYYKIASEDILIIHDDIDQEFSHIKLQRKRGHGGHNGIRHIHQQLGHNEYARLKLGVGRPPHPKMDVADYVLQKFNDDEMNSLDDFLDRAIQAIDSFIVSGFDKAANNFNQTP